MVNKRTLTALLILLICATTLQSQWVREQGKGYYKLSAMSLVADQHYTDEGDIDPNATRGYFNLNFYGEHGITDKLDVIAYIPIFARTYQNDQISGTTGELIQEGESLNGIGDVDISLRYGFIQNQHLAFSASILFGLPLGNDSGGSDGSYQTGDGEFNQMIRAEVGIPFKVGSLPAYAKAYSGYNNRTGDFSDEFHFGAEAGLNLFSHKLWLSGRLAVVESLQNGSLSAQTNQGSIFANNVEYTSVGGELAYYLTDKMGISFAYGGALSGRIIYANPIYSAGVFLDIK